MEAKELLIIINKEKRTVEMTERIGTKVVTTKISNCSCVVFEESMKPEDAGFPKMTKIY